MWHITLICIQNMVSLLVIDFAVFKLWTMNVQFLQRHFRSFQFKNKGLEKICQISKHHHCRHHSFKQQCKFRNVMQSFSELFWFLPQNSTDKLWNQTVLCGSAATRLRITDLESEESKYHMPFTHAFYSKKYVVCWTSVIYFVITGASIN